MSSMSQLDLFAEPTVPVLDLIRELVERSALFVINHSGGKDSQAMTAVVRAMVPVDQLLFVHAILDEVEWPGVKEHVEDTCGEIPGVFVRGKRKLLDMVAERGMFPSPKFRQCTSDLKRGPIEKAIRAHLAANPRFGGLIVNCMGMRAEESSNRSRLEPFKFNASNSKAGREWYDWLPIHDMLIEEVWSTISAAGQVPHPAYSLGMSRLSCCFCIMSSDADLRVAAIHQPKLFARYVALEKSTGRTMMMPRKGVAMNLEQITGITADKTEASDVAA